MLQCCRLTSSSKFQLFCIRQTPPFSRTCVSALHPNHHLSNTYPRTITVTVTTHVINPNQRRTIAKRDTTTTIIPTKVPAYASACTSAAAYSSACSCWGIAATVSTASTPLTTTTVTVPGDNVSCKVPGYGDQRVEIGYIVYGEDGETCRQ